MEIGTRRPRHRLRVTLIVLGLVIVAGALWFVFRVGPAPAIELQTDRPAVGKATLVSADFSEPSHGLGEIRLELVQGDRVEILASDSFERPMPWPWRRGGGTGEATLAAVVGSRAHDWLTEGDVTLRAVAHRSSGLLRRVEAASTERRLPVRLRPPEIELLSTQHYGRQGGAGALSYRVGETAIVSGVRAGSHESYGAPVAGGRPGDRWVIFALPWDLEDDSEIRLFAEDDAGNRVEQPFLDGFQKRQPRSDEIRVSDAFLARVVPAIASRTAGFDDSGSLLDQYLVINGELRRAELARIRELSAQSGPDMLWSGAFEQMPNTARMAGFAEIRRYLYDGREVDRQTHLGLDLASTTRAEVPAPNSGRVLYAGWMTLYGNAVIVDHGLGLLSISGHLSSVEVAGGEIVEKGQIIGRSGATGLAGGDHLHLEIAVHGKSVDPIQWLDPSWIENNITSKLGRP
jgi:murein DD-endopeptidase MepM/ murein hydrolase activator NlpD